jgi:hypothetical protein
MNRKRAQQQNKRSRRKTGLKTSLLDPPQFVPTLKTTQKFRFTADAAVSNVPVTRGNLLNLVEMADGITDTHRLYGAVRLKSIQMWAVPTSTATTPSTATVEWLGFNAPSTFVSDTSVSNARPLHVFTRPPANSSCKWWTIYNENEAEQLLAITCPQGSVVDIVLTMRLQDNEGDMGGESGTTGLATAGVIYLNYLDGFSSKLLKPLMANPVLP